MSERDIDANISALIEALKTDNRDAAVEPLRILIGGLLKDVARVADALEILSTPPGGP